MSTPVSSYTSSAPRSHSYIKKRISSGDILGATVAIEASLYHSPSDSFLWTQLSIALFALKRPSQALCAVEVARNLNTIEPKHLLDIGITLNKNFYLTEAHQTLTRALTLAPDNTDIQIALAFCLWSMGSQKQYREVLENIIRKHPTNAKARLGRAEYLLRRGQFSKAWDDYDWHWRVETKNVPFQSPAPMWDGRINKNATLLIWDEQGIGDAVLASRFISLARPRFKKLFIICRPSLRRLLSNVILAEEIVIHSSHDASSRYPQHDVHCSLLGLIRHFVYTTQDIPPPATLFSAPITPHLSHSTTLPCLRIGIAWTGNPSQSLNSFREVPIEYFLRLARIPGVALYSLQKGEKSSDIVKGFSGLFIRDAGVDSFELEETATLIRSLDLVITIDTSIAHIAGSLGVEVWTLLCTSSFWIYGARGDTTPWYPRMRLFRQKTFGDWEQPLREIEQSLKDRLSRLSAPLPKHT